jgi:hypothetical protein
MGPKTIRSRALECMQLAQNTAEPRHQAILLDMAHCWANLANAADRFALFVEAVEPRLKKPRRARERAERKIPGTRPSKMIVHSARSFRRPARKHPLKSASVPKQVGQSHRFNP